MRIPLAILAALAALAGCLDIGPVGRQAADCPAPVAGETHHPGVWPSQAVAGEVSDLVYLATSDRASTFAVGPESVDGGAPRPTGAVEDVRVTRPQGTVHFGFVRVGFDQAAAGLRLGFRLLDGDAPDCPGMGGLSTNWGAHPADGERPAARPGQGAHVWYAGFYASNGTLFDTNMQLLDVGEGARWPRAGWYPGNHWDPIPVYVYDRDRTEQPAHWKAPASALPPEADPADPVVNPVLNDANEPLGAGYFTTIRGFNEALKGLPAGARQAFVLAPEDAYTAPGRETHLLYGESLVFLIEVMGVVDAPCPSPPTTPGACRDLAP